MTRKTYWCSSPKMTVMVEVTDGIITGASPIVKVFIGQPFENLKRWARFDRVVEI